MLDSQDASTDLPGELDVLDIRLVNEEQGLESRCFQAGCDQDVRLEARKDVAVFLSPGAHESGSRTSAASTLDLDHDPRLHPLHDVEDIGETGQALATKAIAEAVGISGVNDGEVRPEHRSDPSCRPGGSVQGGIVDHDQLTITAGVHVDLDPLRGRAQTEGGLNGSERVFRGMGRVPPMGNPPRLFIAPQASTGARAGNQGDGCQEKYGAHGRSGIVSRVSGQYKCKGMKDVLILDGAMGTELRARGARVPSHKFSIWSAAALEEDPEKVIEVHNAYLQAGSEVITANNYAVTGPLLAREGLEHRVEDLTRLAVELALRAREMAGSSARVAASLPPLETSYRADLVPEQTVLRDEYARIRDSASQADLLICETLSCSREAVAAATVALESDAEVWVSFTLQGNRPNLLPGGEALGEALADVSSLRVGDRSVGGLLVNCCGANLVGEAMPLLAKAAAAAGGARFGGYANADETLPGAFDPADPEQVPRKPLDPPAYADHAASWIRAGASIVGGCCDTRPYHIDHLVSMVREDDVRQ